ncbi:heme anaerobic degradation radical SAM methyltransferase ChuW/HutW [Vibrio sp. qd031]|uniref:heme anaerobic degradation radical SAM methyltransferase ChuW/HutW n=1 Tax=Vibrio sp. qd031 TaxID=1603038 RepID=UPI000A0F7302|nr:heme anaerobic degradation radical SAM methyltransferase ChuW/HutW [Vibrio sp. qd031]
MTEHIVFNRDALQSLLDDESVVGRSTPDPLRFAFARKKGAHAGGMSKPINPSSVQSALTHALTESSLAQPAIANDRCLYIHIPFCRVRCTYCNFFQYASSTSLIEDYFTALEAELIYKASFSWSQAFPFQAVYVGGGTPTDLSAAQIERLGKLIREHFPLTPDCEITLEGRVNRFSTEKFEAALEGGFNRFSLGVQSFDTHVRRKAKRLDDQEVVVEHLATMVSYNAAPIVIDLLYGLPFQTLDIWQRDLEFYLDSGVDGVDLYQLIEMQNLPMGRMVEQGKLPAPADTQMKATMFQMGVEFMAKHHQRRLSVNHWASGNRERSIYNSLAKTSAEVLPIGAGAGGNFNGVSAMQHRDMDAYISAVNSNSFPVGMAFQSPIGHQSSNTVKAAFDRGVLRRSELGHTSEGLLFDALLPLFEAWQQRGLVNLEEHALSLTLAGQFWSVTLAQNLISTMARCTSKPNSHAPSPENGIEQGSKNSHTENHDSTHHKNASKAVA